MDCNDINIKKYFSLLNKCLSPSLDELELTINQTDSALEKEAKIIIQELQQQNLNISSIEVPKHLQNKIDILLKKITCQYNQDIAQGIVEYLELLSHQADHTYQVDEIEKEAIQKAMETAIEQTGLIYSACEKKELLADLIKNAEIGIATLRTKKEP